MSEHTKLFERAAARYEPPDLPMDGLLKRRDRKRRNQRIAAGVVGIAVFVGLVWIVTSVGSLDRSETSVVPGGDVTGPAVETGPVETGPSANEPHEAVGPVPETDYLLDLNTGQMTPLPESIAGERPSEFAASPDGTRLAYVDRGDNDEPQIFVANLDGTGIEQVTHDLKPPSSLVWSPDGSRIAYIQATNEGGDAHNLFVLDLARGKSTQLTFATSEPDPAAPDLGPWMVSSASFTSDGSSIVYGISRGDNIDYGEVEVRMVPVAGGKSELLIRDEHDDGVPTIDAPRLSPDGSLLSYNCGPLVSFCVANADGTDERVLVQSQGDALTGGDWSPDGTRIAYSRFHGQDVFVADVATGQATYVAEGGGATWLDDHTLIVGMSKCYDASTGAWGNGCGG